MSNSGGSRDEEEEEYDDAEEVDEDDEINDPLLSSGRNPFFGGPGAGDRGSGRVYAAIEVPDPGDEVGPADERGEPILLECVDTSWFYAVHNSAATWVDLYRTAPLSVLELTSYPLPAFPDDARPGDIVWFEFGYEYVPRGQSTGRVYTRLFSQGTPVRITFHEHRGIDWPGDGPLGRRGWLTGELGGMSGLAHGTQALDAARSCLDQLANSSGVAIYDVGQGSCQALLDKVHHIPLVYIDLGGGVLGNSRTFPKSFRGMCFSNQPPVVLSHWDWDHWSSAYRFPKALDLDWIAPAVPHKPIQQAFAADLYVRGRLHLWQDSWPNQIAVPGMRLERCTGATTNDAGLAVTLNTGYARGRNCLLPGDASYRFIPSVIASERFSMLCMSHHGGRLHSKHYPLARRNAAAINSSGAGNSYGHPLFATLGKHIESGWMMPAQTGFAGDRPSHVFVPWGKRPHVFQGGCHAQECSVAIAKTVPQCTSINILAEPAPTTVSKVKVLTSV
jgi:hypothetical protein